MRIPVRQKCSVRYTRPSLSPDTVAVFSSTLSELASPLVPSFEFLRKPKRFSIYRDLPALIDSDSEGEEHEYTDLGPMSESIIPPINKGHEVKSIPLQAEIEMPKKKWGVWQRRNAQRQRAVTPDTVQQHS